ncbi:MAG: tetratricopeptide repeat protein [Acidobacteriota bacterium]
MRALIGFVVVLLATGCRETSKETDAAVENTRAARQRVTGIEAPVLSLFGEPLPPVELSDEVRARFENRLAAARAEYETNPENADALIWLGRRLAYLGRYREAIEVFSRGMEIHPDDARFYRHRGHRYITTRQLDLAIADLETAADLVADDEDQVEPDGLPNERGIPTSTLQTNIWYHLGLARYLAGDFVAALAAYEKCLELSTNPDMLVATTHWLYMTLRRLGRQEAAAAVLEPITADLDIIENHDYHRLLLFYRGELGEDEVTGDETDGPGSAAAQYGLGNWHYYEGRPERAEEIYLELLESEQWAAFGYLAAEAELARANRRL